MRTLKEPFQAPCLQVRTKSLTVITLHQLSKRGTHLLKALAVNTKVEDHRQLVAILTLHKEPDNNEKITDKRIYQLNVHTDKSNIIHTFLTLDLFKL